MAVLSDIIGWLRKGYPEGVPDGDYIPLFALLGRHLTDEEVRDLADELSGSGDQHSRATIHAAIAGVTHETPRESDIARVSARLAFGGWPLARPDTDS
jgi:hypothetical protein